MSALRILRQIILSSAFLTVGGRLGAACVPYVAQNAVEVLSDMQNPDITLKNLPGQESEVIRSLNDAVKAIVVHEAGTFVRRYDGPYVSLRAPDPLDPYQTPELQDDAYGQFYEAFAIVVRTKLLGMLKNGIYDNNLIPVDQQLGFDFDTTYGVIDRVVTPTRTGKVIYFNCERIAVADWKNRIGTTRAAMIGAYTLDAERSGTYGGTYLPYLRRSAANQDPDYFPAPTLSGKSGETGLMELGAFCMAFGKVPGDVGKYDSTQIIKHYFHPAPPYLSKIEVIQGGHYDQKSNSSSRISGGTSLYSGEWDDAPSGRSPRPTSSARSKAACRSWKRPPTGWNCWKARASARPGNALG